MRESKTYIGVKLIQGTPMTRGEYNKHRGWDIPANEDSTDEGYLVQNPDGHETWSPEGEFNKYNLQLSPDPELDGPSVTPSDVAGFVTTVDVSKINDRAITVTTATRSGFDLFESSSCVDPTNFDPKIGAQIGHEKNMDKLWGHMGFLLCWATNGLSPLPQAPAPTLQLAGVGDRLGDQASGGLDEYIPKSV